MTRTTEYPKSFENIEQAEEFMEKEFPTPFYLQMWFVALLYATALFIWMVLK